MSDSDSLSSGSSGIGRFVGNRRRSSSDSTESGPGSETRDAPDPDPDPESTEIMSESEIREEYEEELNNAAAENW